MGRNNRRRNDRPSKRIVLLVDFILTTRFCSFRKLLSSSLQEQQFLQHSLLPSYDKLSKLKSNGSTWFNKIELLWNQMKLNFEKVENNITKFYQDSLFRSYSIIEFLKKYSTKICHPSSSW